jgi:hypothetical protein
MSTPRPESWVNRSSSTAVANVFEAQKPEIICIKGIAVSSRVAIAASSLTWLANLTSNSPGTGDGYATL